MVERLLEPAAEPGKGAVVRLDVAGQPQERHLVFAGFGDPPRRADVATPGVEQGSQHHLRLWGAGQANTLPT